ncbi:MAG: translesion DNA synthesis-associated protein ImuA [Betaproteobacteria bacterium]|nr:translesion DNA synthesis-associated protein ImuA [Betaproteobacteria bacterium]
MSAASSSPFAYAADLPDQVWRADALAAPQADTVSSGDAALDAQLPGGGWPVGALTELIQAPGVHLEWRLLLPALLRCGQGPVVLVGAPALGAAALLPFAPALAGLGLPWQRLLWLRATDAQLWMAEQALRCAPVDAVLLWRAQVRPQELRRLQLAAAQHHKLLFVMRHSEAAHTASPAVLRVQIAPCATHATGLRVEILKRRGPPVAHAIQILPAQGQLARVLAAALVPAPVAVADTAPLDVFADAPALDRAAA